MASVWPLSGFTPSLSGMHLLWYGPVTEKEKQKDRDFPHLQLSQRIINHHINFHS